jgi:hypothetical protein
MKYITFAIALMLIGCATPSDVHSASTAQLLERRAEIDRKFAEDDFGVYIGPIRWFSHGSERNSCRQEKAAIDAELESRHVTARTSAGGVQETMPQ